MPTYTFKNLNTGELEEKVMKISELDDFKKANPHLERALVDTPSIGDPVRLGVRRSDNGWRETLSKISERTPGGKVLKDNIR